MTLSYGCVILTLGDRPTALRRALASVRAQRDVDVDCVVVANGATLAEAPEGARVVSLPRNVGIPAGRNAGVRETDADLLVFLDDDAWLADDGLLAAAADQFARQPEVGILSLRLTDPDGRRHQRRHVPRLRARDPARSSDVTTFLGGAAIIRRVVFDRAGMFPEEFFYAHEELSLAWRAIDAGFRVRYDGSLVVFHPSLPGARHAEFHYLVARNRVFLARRHLPWLTGVPYLAVWLFLSVARAGGLRGVRHALRGFWDGARQECGPRQPIGWAAVWRMTRLGRPPVI